MQLGSFTSESPLDKEPAGLLLALKAVDPYVQCSSAAAQTYCMQSTHLGHPECPHGTLGREVTEESWCSRYLLCHMTHGVLVSDPGVL